jgi:hypothetical protein
MRRVMWTGLLGWGCSGEQASDKDSADTGSPTEPWACASDIRVTYAEGGCLGYPDQWDFKVDVAGCAASALFNVWDTSVTLDWDEQHPMTLALEGPDGAYQNWTLGPLPHQTPAEQWQSGVNTVFDCVSHLDALTYGVRLYDDAGDQVTCMLWGHDPALVLSGGVSAVNSDAASTFSACEVGAF